MRFLESTGRKVVSTADASTVAVVDGLVVDPGSRTVRAVQLKKSDGGNLLRWEALTAFGADAVTVPSADALTSEADDLADLVGKDHHLLGKRVLSAAGVELGAVKDVEFDPESGSIVSLVLGDGEVPGVRLVGVGSYAVVVATA